MTEKLGNYSEPALNRYLHGRARRLGVPLAGNFELTPCCNLQCRMCYVRKDASEAGDRLLPADQWLDWGEEAVRAGMLFLLLTGGEPLTHPQFREIYLGLKKMGLMVSVNTNGTLINEEMADFLAAEAPARVNLSLYGASPETYERLCGSGAAYEKAVRAIELLLARGVHVKLNYSATPSNAADLPEIFRFADEHRIRVQTTAYMFPAIRRGRVFEQDDRFSAEQAGCFQYRTDALRYPPDRLRERTKAIRAGAALPDPDSECMDQPQEPISCRAGRTSFWMTWDGMMRPCGMMTEPSADAKSLGFSQAWQAVREAAQQIVMPAKCAQCGARSLCPVCPAACLAENGAFGSAPHYLCEMTAAYLRQYQLSEPSDSRKEE